MGLRALEREGLDSFVDQQRVTDDDSQPDLRALGGGSSAAALLGKLPEQLAEQLPTNMHVSAAQRARSDPAAAAAAAADGEQQSKQ